MSIYATRLVLEDEPDPHDGRRAPIRYQGSHVLPGHDDPRAGRLVLCEIPGFVERPGRPARSQDDDGTPVWPWLRLMVDDGEPGTPAVLVLDRTQVRAINSVSPDGSAAQAARSRQRRHDEDQLRHRPRSTRHGLEEAPG